MNKPTYMKVAKEHLKNCREHSHLKVLTVGSCAVRGIDEAKAKNMVQFGQHSDKRTQARYFCIYKTQRRTLSTRCAHRQNILRNGNESDFKSEEENCIS